MDAMTWCTPGRLRSLMQVALAALGLCFIGACSVQGCVDPCPEIPLPPIPTIEPAFAVVQVGGTALLAAVTPEIANPTYQWRVSRGGPSVDIPGAMGATYKISGAQLPDNGAQYSVAVHGVFNGGPIDIESFPTHLSVSSMPGIVFRDGEFPTSDWVSAAVSSPAASGPTHAEEQATTGGNPDAYRTQAVALPAGPSKLVVSNEFQPATYDPATQGPIYLIEFSRDCIVLPGTVVAAPRLLIEQDGRRFALVDDAAQCGSAAWRALVSGPIIGPEGFIQVDGPGCAAGEFCPDFSGAGRPIRFGFASSYEGIADSPAATGGFGIDNWKVTVWRR